MLLWLKRWAARKYLYRKLDRIGMPRSESRPLVEYVVATQFPSKSQPMEEGMRNRKGFLLPAAMWWIYAGIAWMTALGWAFIYDHREQQPRDERWFMSAPVR